MPPHIGIQPHSHAVATPPGEQDGLRVLLVRLTVALNRRRAYAPTHPMVRQAEAALVEALTDVLDSRASITLGIAHRELLVDGELLDADRATTRELAERLHRRGVGALAFEGAISLDAVGAALEWLATEPPPPAPGSSGDTAVTPHTVAPRIPGIAIASVAYERLALQDGLDEAHDIKAIWRSLAVVVFDGDEKGAPDDSRTGAYEQEQGSDERSIADVAAAIARRAVDQAYARRVGLVMQSVVAQLQGAPVGVRQEIATRLSSVLTRLAESNLGAILRMVGSSREQHRFIAALIDILPATAIVEWLGATSKATDQQLSHHLLRILIKLSSHAGRRAAAADAPEALRGTARALVAGWELEDPNPCEHGALLDFVASRQASTAVRAPGVPDAGTRIRTQAHDDAARLVQMACEIDALSLETFAAAHALVADGRVALLLAWLREAPGQQAARDLRAAITTPEALLIALLNEPFDARSARALLEDLDVTVAPILLDALERARLRSARRAILDTLRAFGPALAPLLQERLTSTAPWYLTRNLLLLMRDVTAGAAASGRADVVEAFMSFLDHPREQVRLEALRLLLDMPFTRDAAMRRALADDSPRLVVYAIKAAAHDIAAADIEMARNVAGRLMALIERNQQDQDVQARAIRALSPLGDSGVVEFLVRQVSRRTRWLRRQVLARTAPTVLAALYVLACRHADHPVAAEVLRLARRCATDDPRRAAVLNAATGVGA